MENKTYSRLEMANVIIFVAAIFFGIGVLVGGCANKDNSTRPVGEIVKADSLIKANDSIKIVVNDLDSVKNAKVIEVKELDNDSTLKLFYELVRE